MNNLPGQYPTESMQAYKRRRAQAIMMEKVIACENIEDIKILLLSWIDDGSVTRRIPAPWEK